MAETVKKLPNFFVGIDEVGRGPLAGPVAVAAVVSNERRPRFARGVRDSKQLTAKARKLWLRRIKAAHKRGTVDFYVAFASHEIIDRTGIVSAIKHCLTECLDELQCQSGYQIILDGGLKAPETFKRQETIIRGDEQEPLIALASIIAKVARDELMTGLAKKYPAYKFERNKGYGTRDHYEAIKLCGVCDIHRKSFIHIDNTLAEELG